MINRQIATIGEFTVQRLHRTVISHLRGKKFNPNLLDLIDKFQMSSIFCLYSQKALISFDFGVLRMSYFEHSPSLYKGIAKSYILEE